MGQKLTTPRLRSEAEPFRGVSLAICDGVLDSWYACAEGYFVSKSECFAIVRRSGLLEVLKARLQSSADAQKAIGAVAPPIDVGFWTRSDLLSTGNQSEAAESSVLSLFGVLASPRGKMDILHLLVPLVLFAEAERVDRLKMLFRCWDVTGNGKLSSGELVHAFKVSVTGLLLWEATPAAEPPSLPMPRDLEAAALSVYLHSDKNEDHVVLESDLLRFSWISPDAKSWLDAYDALLAQKSSSSLSSSSSSQMASLREGDDSLFLRRQLRSLHERPPKRKLQSSLTYVADASTLVVFGGYSAMDGPAMEYLEDGASPTAAVSVSADVVLYRLKPALVERVRPLGQQPPARAAHAHCSIKGSAASGVLFFGGVGKGETLLNDLWFLWHIVEDDDEDTGAGLSSNLGPPAFAWLQVAVVGGRSPVPRRHASMVQASQKVVVACGGVVAGGNCSNDVHVLEALSEDWAAAQWQTVRFLDGEIGAPQPPPLFRPVIFRMVDQTGRFPIGAHCLVVFGGVKMLSEAVPEDQTLASDDISSAPDDRQKIWTLCLVDESEAPTPATASSPVTPNRVAIALPSPVVPSPAVPSPLPALLECKTYSMQWICSTVDGDLPLPREGAVASQPIAIERGDNASGLASPGQLSSPTALTPISARPMSPMRSPMSPMARGGLPPVLSPIGGQGVIPPSPSHRQKSKSAMKKEKEDRKLIMKQKTLALTEVRCPSLLLYVPIFCF